MLGATFFLVGGGILPTLHAVVRCNGNASLSDKRYNAITQIMTHNATSTTQKRLLGVIKNPVADQHNSLERQLRDGIRAFKLPVHQKSDGTLVVAHTLPKKEFERYLKKLPTVLAKSLKKNIGTRLWRIDATHRKLSDVIQEVEVFLDNHPHEVITLLLNSFVGGSVLVEGLSTLNLAQYLHIQEDNQPWPTLRQMVKNNKRLIIFTDERAPSIESDGYEWVKGLHATSDWVYGNAYSYKTVKALQQDPCTPCGNAYIKAYTEPNNTLVLLNNFVTRGIAGCDVRARKAHTYELLKHRVEICRASLQRSPNFIHVDFYDENKASLKRIVQELNAL